MSESSVEVMLSNYFEIQLYTLLVYIWLHSIQYTGGNYTRQYYTTIYTGTSYRQTKQHKLIFLQRTNGNLCFNTFLSASIHAIPRTRVILSVISLRRSTCVFSKFYVYVSVYSQHVSLKYNFKSFLLSGNSPKACCS